ncbi:MAG TPA: hypothetical protein VGK85_13230 [Myxococcaceae bacterium]|jgi:hypothetical protein
MRRALLAAATLAGVGLLACLGPYPNLAEKLDGVDLVKGTSYLALDAGAARILILAPFDGGRTAPFTRIDEQQPRAVETLQGTYSGNATNSLDITFSSTTLFLLPNEASKPVSARSGASRHQLSPPLQSKVHIDTSTVDVLDLSGSGDIAGHFLRLLGRTALITGNDANATACAFHLANLAVESSEARIPGFNSPGLTQYLNRQEPFEGILSGTVTIGLVGLFSPVTTNTFQNYADFEGVVLDGVQISSTDTGGNGLLSGVLGFRIARDNLPPLEGSVDYSAVTLSGGNESGNYLVTLDGGTTYPVPTGRRIPSLEQCLGL